MSRDRLKVKAFEDLADMPRWPHSQAVGKLSRHLQASEYLSGCKLVNRRLQVGVRTMLARSSQETGCSLLRFCKMAAQSGSLLDIRVGPGLQRIHSWLPSIEESCRELITSVRPLPCTGACRRSIQAATIVWQPA